MRARSCASAGPLRRAMARFCGRALPLALLGCAAHGCSLLELGEFEIPVCKEQPGVRSPCEVLDARDGISSTACEHWQCRGDAPGCELRPKDSDGDRALDERVCSGMDQRWTLDCDDAHPERARGRDERCDGVDNDCDQTIDEEALDLAAEPRELNAIDVAGLTRGRPLELRALDGRSALTLVSDGRAWLVDFARESASEIRYHSAAADGDAGDEKACPRIGVGGPVACNMRQLTLSAGPSSLLGAAVSDDIGCPDGELRIGVSASDVNPRLFLGPSDAQLPNDLAYGVDVSPERRCPDVGVSSPSLASLRTSSGEQALAIWLERSVDAAADSCSELTGAAALRAIGVWVSAGAQPSLIASGAGRSRPLDASRGGRPALLSFSREDGRRAGYIAGYGAASGRLTLLVNGALPARDASAELAPPAPQSFGEGEHVDRVALAADGDSEPLRFAAAYRSGCGDEQAISLALFRLGDALDNYATVRIGPAAGGGRGPFLSYVANGFRTEEPRGGWLVVYEDAPTAALLARRVSVDGYALDPEPFRVWQGDVDAAACARDARGHVSYLVVKRDTRKLESAPILCSVD
jgi:hypothetical protein